MAKAQIILGEVGGALDSKCIPVMTAQSTPSGNATASNYASNYPPYKAFSADATGWYVTSAAFLNNWVKYEFDTAMVAHIFLGMAIANGALKFSIYGSNDDFASENDLLASDVVVDTTTFYKPTFLNNSKAYKYYKFLVTESNASSSCNGLKLQLIGA
jgi:hypothetical protein